MAYTEADYAAARNWATGKTGSDIFGKAQELGLSSADLAGVFGSSGDLVSSATGYGTEGGLRADADQWRYLGGTQNGGGDWVNRNQPPPPAPSSGIPPMQQNVQLRQYEKNPYLDQMAAGIMQQQTRNLNEQIMPGIRQNAIAAGGFGDARHGVADGLAIGRTNDAISRELTNLYGNDYQQTQNRNAQMYGMDQSYNLGLGNLGLQQQKMNNDYSLGLGNLGLGYTQADNSLNLGMTNAGNTRYATDKSYEVGMANAAASSANAAANQATAAGQLGLAQDRFGFESALTLQDRLMGYNNLGLSAAGQIQNTPMNYWNQFSQGANSLGQGYGTTTQSGGGNPLMGAIGGAQLGNQAANWWNSQNATSSPGTAWYSGNQGMGD